MEDFNSETDSDYTSYWRDWVGAFLLSYTLSSRCQSDPCAMLFLWLETKYFAVAGIKYEALVLVWRSNFYLLCCYMNGKRSGATSISSISLH